MKHQLQMDLSPPGCVETTLSILNVLQGIRLRSKRPFRLARQTQIHLQPVFHEGSGPGWLFGCSDRGGAQGCIVQN